MDPVTAVGLTLGGAQLTIQVFESVVKSTVWPMWTQVHNLTLQPGFAFFECAANADQDCQTFRLRLRFEYARLREWGVRSGLSDESTRLQYNEAMGDRKLLVLALLNELKSKLRQMRQKELRYQDILSESNDSKMQELDRSLPQTFRVTGDIADPDDSSATTQEEEGPGALSEKEWEAYYEVLSVSDEGRKPSRHKKSLNHIVSWAQGALKIVKQPKRIVWAIKDKKKFSEDIDLISVLTSHLLETLSRDKMQAVLKDTQEIRLALAAMNKTLEGMLALQQTAQTPSIFYDTRSSIISWGGTTQVGDDVARDDGTLLSETRFKLFIQQATDFSIQMRISKTAEIDCGLGDKQLTFSLSRDSQTIGQRESAAIEGKIVWVEWRPYFVTQPHYVGSRVETRVHEKIRDRANMLGCLLKTEKKPSQFRVPPFMGLYDDKRNRRFGFVFQSPPETAGQDGISLSERLQDQAVNLSDRMSIAQQLTQWLLYLHTVDWLHKGIRSSSILFFTNSESGYFGDAYVTGFQYSRVVVSDTITTGPIDDPEGAMYTHPEYLGGMRYRKTYDVYSLGIVLLELAFWAPIEEILRVGTQRQTVTPHQDDLGETLQSAQRGVVDTRQQILTPEHGILERLEQTMGKRYALATKACIEGMPAFGLGEDKDQTDPLISGLLQQAFIRVVVEPLQSVVV